MLVRDFIGDYKSFLDNFGYHETRVARYIKQRALDYGYEVYNGRRKKYIQGDKIIFEFRDKLIALVELGKSLEDGSNVIVSHMDSPCLSIIPGNPIVEREDGVFVKVNAYGGIISQLWLDTPLVLVGRVYNDNDELIEINTEKDGYIFSISSLLPHLNGRKEVKDLTMDKLLVRIGNSTEDNIFEIIKEKYGINKKNLELAELNFVPYGKVMDIGFDKDLMMGRGHDDLSSVFAGLEAMLSSEPSNMTKIFLGVSYEETGSSQSTGAVSEFIDDIFLELAEGNILLARECIRNSKVISGDVTCGYDATYSNHFEDGAKVVVGKGTGIVPFTGNKRGNDSSVQMRNYIKRLCLDNDIDYQVDTVKVGQGGGGTVAMFFGTRGCEVIDIGVGVISMHSHNEIISKSDLMSTYELYKVFLENN